MAKTANKKTHPHRQNNNLQNLKQMKKKKNSLKRKKNPKKEIMKTIYTVSFHLAEIGMSILINHFMQ